MFVTKVTIFLIKVKITWSRYLIDLRASNSNKHWENQSYSWGRIEKSTNLRVWKISLLIEIIAIGERNKIWEIKGYLCLIDIN